MNLIRHMVLKKSFISTIIVPLLSAAVLSSSALSVNADRIASPLGIDARSLNPSRLNLIVQTPGPPSALIVTNTNDSGPGSLRQAIQAASAGDTVEFSLPPGSIINLTTGELLITRNLTINGPGAGQLTIQRSTASGTAQFPVFNISSSNPNVSLNGLTISNGFSDSGGGIRNSSGGTVNLSSCLISGNFGGLGGGVYNNNLGTLNIVNSMILGNSASRGCCGGGISNLGNGTLNVTASTIANNVAQTGGGVYANGFLNLRNSTITGNSASNGGGLNVQLATVILTNTTISNNSAPFGGGLYIYSTAIGARNSIVAANVGQFGPDVYTSGSGTQFSSQGYNLIGNNSGGLILSQATDQIGTVAAPIDPKLGSLADNGGLTLTRPLLTGSPALDKGGGVTGITLDQRGLARPINMPGIADAAGGDGSDIGAFELQAGESGPEPTSDTITYTYDSLNRLLTAAYASGSSITYAYDPAGNRTALQTAGIGVSANTVAGNNVITRGNGVTAKFATVTAGGSTSIAPINFASVGALPNGFHLFDDTAAFNISTTATIQGLIGVCFNNYFNTDAVTFARLRIVHNENGVWVNRTATSDFASGTVCSTVSSLGEFAVVLLGPPTALIDSSSNRAAALNSVNVLRDPVTVIDTRNFSADQRTRLAFFVQSVDLLPAETLSLVTAQARDAQNVVYPLPVESVVKVPNMDWISQVVVKLPDALVGKGDVQVTVKVRGIESSPVTVRVQ